MNNANASFMTSIVVFVVVLGTVALQVAAIA